MKKLLMLVAALTFLGSVIPADARNCPPGKSWYCEGSKCRCV